MYQIGIDVGGTFTDFMVSRSDGDVTVLKEMTTYPDQSIGVIRGLERAGQHFGQSLPQFLSETVLIVHGTTVATNSMLQYRGARVGLICTKGFRDDIEKRRGFREETFFMKYAGPVQIVPRRYRIGVPERVDFAGNVVTPLCELSVREAVEFFKREGLESIAVCFLFSFVNQEHERRVAQIAREVYPEAHISLSCDVLPQIREFERVSTTVVNAYTSPALGTYLTNFSHELRQSGFNGELLIMQSGGGVVPVEYAARMGARALLSGPAGGIVSSSLLARQLGIDNLITVDMGGTSYDVSVIADGRLANRSDAWIGRYKVSVPMLDIHTIGAGGGTIARVDAGGVLKVGPESAGSTPGPACYGKGGTEPTVTDANLVLGYLPESIGHGFSLDLEAATRAIHDKLSAPLGITVTEAASGVVRLVNELMNDAIRVMSVRRGHDMRDFALVAYGGAGALHAGIQALELGIPQVIIPKFATAFSAVGLLMSDLELAKSRSFISLSSELDLAQLDTLVSSMIEEIESELPHYAANDGIEFRCLADLRYPMQTYEITVLFKAATRTFSRADIDGAVAEFHEIHRRLYKYNDPTRPPEIVNIRVTGLVRSESSTAVLGGAAPKQKGAPPKVFREAYFHDRKEFVSTPVLAGDGLREGQEIVGPALIEELGTTIVVNPHQVCSVDGGGNYFLRPA